MLVQVFIIIIYLSNRPFLRCRKSRVLKRGQVQNWKMKMIFYYHAIKTHFYKKGFAFSLVLRVRVFGTRKWPI